jgi:hypothetical protein
MDKLARRPSVAGFLLPLRLPWAENLRNLGWDFRGQVLVFAWSEWPDSNRRPLDPQSSALPGCATLRTAQSPIFSRVPVQGANRIKSPKLEQRGSRCAFGDQKSHRKSHRMFWLRSRSWGTGLRAALSWLGIARFDPLASEMAERVFKPLQIPQAVAEALHRRSHGTNCCPHVSPVRPSQ